MSPTVSEDPSALLRKTISEICAALRFATPVRTRAFAPATSPAGSASTSCAIASAIWAIEMSWVIKLAEGTSITVRGAATPRIVVRVTPSAKSRVTNSSAKRPSCSASSGPLMTTSVTRSRQAPRRTFGSSASSGSVEIASTEVCTSSAARAMSQPGSKSIVIEARPSVDRASVLSTPSTLSKTGSSTCTMALSTSSAPAPSQFTDTVTLSMITSGKNCARICGAAEKPAMIRMTRRRFAAVPWRTKYDRMPLAESDTRDDMA